MKKVLSLVMLLCSLSFGTTALQYARDMESNLDRETVNFPIIKNYADKAINGAFSRAFTELRRKGYGQKADEIEMEWEAYGRTMFVEDRNIGDHKPISVFIAEKYELIEMMLGQAVCKATHISDIKTLNSGIPVVIHPKTFLMDLVQGERVDEYVRHFAGGPAGDDTYYGVIPVCIYWAVNIGLTAAGAPIVSSLVASVAERLMDIAAVNIGEKIYNKFNGGF